MGSNNSGRFLVGHTETEETKKKRILANTESWKLRDDYIKDIKHPYIYNVWRSFMFTAKGKKIGCSEEWKNYRTFYNDVFPAYSENLRLYRRDKTLPFSKDNFMWMDQLSYSLLKESTISLTYNNDTLTMREWAEKLGIYTSAIRNRYYKHPEYSVEELLFGKKRAKKRTTRNAAELSYANVRTKASKMCTSYRTKDRVRRMENNITADWLIENILFELCHYCGTDKMIGCDRRDNSKGHTKDNVIPCCHVCNTTRNNNFSVEEMEILGKTISEINKKRENK